MEKYDFFLIIFLILGAYLNFLPHINYRFPLHVDEWVHFQYSSYLSSNSPLYFGEEYKNNLEIGFHLVLAVLNSFGISYLFIFNYLQSLLFIMICLGFFILSKKILNKISAVFSVLFIVLLKSNNMILGTVFLVPLTIGLVLIPVGIFLVKKNSFLWIPILSSLLIIHPPTALAFFILINIEFILMKKNYIKNLFFQLISFIIAFPLYFHIFINKKIETVSYLSFIPMPGLIFIPRFLGILITIISIIGIYFLFKEREYSIPLYIISLLGFIIIFYNYKLEFFLPYRRALMYLFFIFSIAFGYGFYKITLISKNEKIKSILEIILIIFLLFFSLPEKLETSDYYHVIDEKDYEVFEWIKNNTSENVTFLVDPWKANAFTPISKRKVYSRILQGPDKNYEEKNYEITKFFNDKCSDVNFLISNNISFIYGECNNPSFKELHKNVYYFNYSF